MSDTPYPKVMQRGTDEVTVHSASEQGYMEAEGWRACDGSVVSTPVEHGAPDIDAVETSELVALADDSAYDAADRLASTEAPDEAKTTRGSRAHKKK